ncbi:MAG: hypothetical protein FWC83_01590 [Alphaproteobacteria bacterium]|nr:hypothetical protein [Alphaproteobacteria bacterium]
MLKKNIKILKEMAHKWMHHIILVLTSPKRFFSKIVADGNLDESMMKAFMYGLVGGALLLIMQSIGGGIITFASVFQSLIVIPVLAVAILFVLGGMLMLVSEITGGERDWEIAIKGLASVFFIYPVILVLNTLAFNCWSLWVISAIIDAYVLFLIYNIAIYCMRGSQVRVGIVVGAFALFVATIYMTDYRFGWFMIKNTSAALQCLM